MKAVVFVAVAVCAVCAMADDFCMYKVGDDTYNLTSLGHTPGDRETVFYMLRDGSVVTANLCGKTSLICPNTSSVCLRTSKFTYASRGDDGTMKLEPFKEGDEYGLTATFTTKDACGNSSHYTTKVHLVCAHVRKNQVVSATGDDTSCEIEMIVKTRAVCLDNSSSFSSSSSVPTSSGSSSSSSSSSVPTSSGSKKSSSSAATTLLPSFALVLLALAAYIFDH